MPSVVLSPIGGAGQQFFDNNGNVLAGGKLYTYEAGTTTPQVTYSDNAGNTPNTNPVLLDAAGRPEEEIWLAYATAYKIVLKDSLDVVVYTWDNVTNDYTFPAILPITSGQNLTNLNASQLTSGTFSWTRAPFVPEEAAKKGQPNGYAGLDGAGGLQQTPGANSVQTTALVANAVTKATTVTIAPTSDISTSSLSFVDLTGLTMSVTTTGGDLLVWLSGGMGEGHTSAGLYYAISVNGVDYPTGEVTYGFNRVPIAGHVLVTGLAAGTYTVKARFRSSNAGNTVKGLYGNTIEPYLGNARLTSLELKR